MSIVGQYVGQSYKDVEAFNDIAGNLSGDMEQKIDAQLSFIFEELSEAIAALERGDAVELLDGAVDVWVTTAGLLQKLEAAGFDVAEAMKRVDDNNMSKFPESTPAKAPEGCATVDFNAKYNRFVLKRADGKIMKPVDFQAVNLSDLVPANFFGSRA